MNALPYIYGSPQGHIEFFEPRLAAVGCSKQYIAAWRKKFLADIAAGRTKPGHAERRYA